MNTKLIAALGTLLVWGGVARGADFDPGAFVAAQVAKGEKMIRVPKGVYEVGPGKVASIYLKNVADVTIDFQGSELRGKVRSCMVELEGCRKVTVKNLTIDYPFNLPFTQGVIEKVTGDGDWDVRILGGYPDPANGAWGWPVQAYDPQTGDLVNAMRYLNKIKVVRTAPGRYHVSGGKNRRGKVGDVAVWSYACETKGGAQELHQRAHAVYLLNCAACRIENVTVYSTPGSNGFREMFGAGGNSYVNCRLVPRPPETDPVKREMRRFRSGNHDAFNSRGALRGPNLVRCEAAYHCDDDVNIHGAYQYVSSATGRVARVFVKDLYRDSLHVGDPVQFVTAKGYVPKELLKITALRPVDYTPEEHAAMLKGLCPQMKDSCHTMLEITFDCAHEVLRTGSLFVSQNCAGNHFLLKDCRFGPNRARGFICNASYGRVEGCVFDRLESLAVLSRPSYAWLEGGASGGVTFENCAFLDCGVCIATHPAMASTSECHRAFTFRNCLFRGPRGVLTVRCCDGLKLEGNIFDLPADKAVQLTKVVGKTETPRDPTVTLFMAGDSTLHSRKSVKADAPLEARCLGSWGDALEEHLKPGYRIVNLAMSGRSTKSFIDEGRWAALIAQVRPGDYVFIQFGHNDQKKDKPDVYAAVDGAYRDNLTRFAREVRERGGKPIFGTSMVRRFLTADGKVRDGLGDYPEAVRKLGRELNVPVVDFNASTRELVERTSREESLTWYRASVNKTDFTHPTQAGAKIFARLFIDQVKREKLEIASIFKD